MSVFPSNSIISALKLIVNRLATDPPLSDPGPGSIVRMDPCTAVDTEAIRSAVGGQMPAVPTPLGVHECQWSGSDYEVNLDLEESERMDLASPGAYTQSRI